MKSLKERQRQRYLSSHLIDPSIWQSTLKHHPILLRHTSEELEALRELATTFIHEKQFEGAEGAVVSDEIRVAIAALAVVPILNLGIDWYANWKTVVVVPRAFVGVHTERDRVGVVHEWRQAEVGQAWVKGPVVVSWRDVRASGHGDGFNVVIHEAAHILDMTDGSVNGRPGLHPGLDGEGWFDVCRASFDDLRRRFGSGRRSPIDAYATVSDAEFFAVMAENFFERPRVVEHEYPRLYDLFVEFFRQDPAGNQGAYPVSSSVV